MKKDTMAICARFLREVIEGHIATILNENSTEQDVEDAFYKLEYITKAYRDVNTSFKEEIRHEK